MKHGTYSAYKDGCRCDDCRGANTKYARRWRRTYRSKRRKEAGAAERPCPVCGVMFSDHRGVEIHLGQMHTKVVTWV